ncbi:NUDIX hydrolase [Streptomyces sp. NPDC085946]|uniref:NUDIX hydrolase n=1 Tax=Streptomyces sp. NPDC085946 TaxID=3365744 RepID=UPI0037D45D48
MATTAPRLPLLPHEQWVKTLPQTVVASCVLLLDREDRILLLRYAGGRPGAGTWGLPGGMLDHGEDPLGAARRELHEETGIALDHDPAFLGYDHRTDARGTGPVIDFYFYGGTLEPGRTVRRSPEHDRHAWLPLSGLARTPLTGRFCTLAALHAAARGGTVACLREGRPV